MLAAGPFTSPTICYTLRYNKSTKKTPGKGGARFYKNIGLGFKTPKEAIEGAQWDSLLCFPGGYSWRLVMAGGGPGSLAPGVRRGLLRLRAAQASA